MIQWSKLQQTLTYGQFSLEKHQRYLASPYILPLADVWWSFLEDLLHSWGQIVNFTLVIIQSYLESLRQKKAQNIIAESPFFFFFLNQQKFWIKAENKSKEISLWTNWNISMK